MSPLVTRRQALRIAVGTAGVAGAVTSAAESAPRATTGSRNAPSSTATPTPVGDPGESLYRVSVVDHGVKDVDFENVEGLEFSVRITAPEIAERATARVVLERKNTGQKGITVGTNPGYPYPEYSSNVGDADSLGIVLVSPKTHDLQVSEPGCWGLETLPVIFPGDTTVLDPGESIAVEYEVWAEPTEDRRCVQPGTYSFEERLVTWTLRIEEVG